MVDIGNAKSTIQAFCDMLLDVAKKATCTVQAAAKKQWPPP